MVAATITFEAQLSAPDWTDITIDVMPGWVLQTGFTSVKPDKLIADIGTLTFELRNSSRNSGGLDGYYSPGHANCRTGFGKRTPIRLKTVYDGTTTYYKSYIKSIKPSPGQYSDKRVQVTCQDKMADLARKNVGLLEVQINVRSDELFDLLVADMISSPDNTSFATGPDTFASAFTDILGEKMKLTAIATHICKSDWSKLFMASDSTDGETLTSITRSAGNTASVATLTDVMTDIEPMVTLDNLVTRVKMTAYPNAVDADIETIFTLQNEIYVGPGETKDFYAQFVDSLNGDRICAYDVTDPLTVVTDYRASTQSGDGGRDMTWSCSVDISYGSEPVGADRAHVYVHNVDDTYGLYLNYMVLKGRPIRRRDTFQFEAVSADIATIGEENTLTIDMPYASDTNLPVALANKILDDWGSENVVRAYNVTFIAHQSAALATLAYNTAFGTKITLEETQSGLSHDGLILGKTLSHSGHDHIECRLVVTPSFGISGWRLGVTDYSELEVTTVLAL